MRKDTKYCYAPVESWGVLSRALLRVRPGVCFSNRVRVDSYRRGFSNMLDCLMSGEKYWSIIEENGMRVILPSFGLGGELVSKRDFVLELSDGSGRIHD